MVTSRRIFIFVVCIAVIAAIFVIYFTSFRAPRAGAGLESFVVPISAGDAAISSSLKSSGFIRSSLAFDLTVSLEGLHARIQPGGYRISKSMNLFELVAALAKPPYLKWVVIPEGLRKEETADILGKALSWNNDQKTKWITTYTAIPPEYFEGVYFPDTYLIPVDESPQDVASRLQAKFQEKFAPYSKEALKQNIKWDTLLKIASIIEREAGKNDMPLISGIIWNRLLQGMKLDVDSTVQYARGNSGQGWWAPLKPGDTKIDSPYNTYLYKGLPPHPISNPGLGAIDAALHSAKTDCLYYLHDKSGVIHCAATYVEHLRNIRKFLGSD